MHYIKTFALLTLLFNTSSEAKNIFSFLLCCCKKEAGNPPPPPPLALPSALAASASPTPIASASGSTIEGEGYLKIVAVVEHPGLIAPNPTPVSGIK